MNNAHYKKLGNNISHWICGPDSRTCPCCRKGSKKDVKKNTNKILRKKTREILNHVQRFVPERYVA